MTEPMVPGVLTQLKLAVDDWFRRRVKPCGAPTELANPCRAQRASETPRISNSPPAPSGNSR